MNAQILTKLKEVKERYEPEGFIILGVFGSYARNEETADSDIDILYECTESFYNQHCGWNIYPVIENIQQNIESEFKHKIDLANKNALNEISRKHILPEMIYV